MHGERIENYNLQAVLRETIMLKSEFGCVETRE
jgi:hypothetical protein